MPELPPDYQGSMADTAKHIGRVQELIADAIRNLQARATNHDQSKLLEPELSAFARLKALDLSGMAYGSDEYRACLRAEKPAIAHHYAANSHHPEHYANGLDGMSLLDLLEMILDWKAATERMKDGGSIRKSLEMNRARFEISDQLYSILANTLSELGW